MKMLASCKQSGEMTVNNGDNSSEKQWRNGIKSRSGVARVAIIAPSHRHGVATA